MPHALTDRQRDYLNFIKSYIAQNELSPRLEEVAGHFDVKPPTAHKTLEALQRKGFLIFDRTSTSGFFIRLIERAWRSRNRDECASDWEGNLNLGKSMISLNRWGNSRPYWPG